jgi:Ser/Thr protein kinase RdoA (MazF antagonist)
MTARVHGMAGDAAPAFWPRLTHAALAPVLARYPDLGAVGNIAWHSARPFAASGIVACASGQVFVKRHDPRVRDAAALREEHGFIAHLLAHGARVPCVLANEEGATVTMGADGVYEIHALGIGWDRYRDAHSWTPVRDCDDAWAAGSALAQLHRAATGYDAPARQARLIVAGDALIGARDPMAAMAQWEAGTDALAGRPWREDCNRVLRPLLEAWRVFADGAATCWVHGDFHVSNLLWQGSEVSSVLDFGLCNRATAVFDVATAIERNAIAWLERTPSHTAIGHAELARAILAGYESVCPVNRDKVRAILPVVHVDFALSELKYFVEITRSASDADLAYHAFLLGHAEWFTTKDGKSFLESLK